MNYDVKTAIFYIKGKKKKKAVNQLKHDNEKK